MIPADNTCDVMYKVLMVGESSVGKTSVIRGVTAQGFNPEEFTTIGIDFVNKIYDVEGAKVQLQIWDTAGQERFRSITRFHYRGTKGIVLVYDVTSKDSFSMIDYWMESIDRDLDRNNTEPVPVYLIGNKTDLVNQREVSTAKGQKAATANLVHGFMETSAKTNTNIDSVFQQLAYAMVEIYDRKLLHSYQTPEEQLRRQLEQAEKKLAIEQSIGTKEARKLRQKGNAKNGHTIHLNSKEEKSKCVCNNG